MAALRSIAAAVCGFIACAAHAQNSGLEEITVTGSRIRQNQDFVSPNPVTTVSAEYLQNLGIVNIADAITHYAKLEHAPNHGEINTELANLPLKFMKVTPRPISVGVMNARAWPITTA